MVADVARRTPLIGRERDLNLLRTRLAEAGRSNGGTVLVAGEAGIGKSRLVAELIGTAAAAGFRVLQGACFESDRTLPYAPIADLLRNFVAGQTPAGVAGLLGAAAPDLTVLLPELVGRLPGVASPVPLDPEQDRHRLAQTAIGFLVGLAAERPLLVVEDLHWGDDSSMELLHACARRLAQQPVLLVLTYRDDEAGEGLAHLVAELERARFAEEIGLRRLGAADVDAMLRAIFAQAEPVRPDFLDTICELTDGNPFFVEEAIKALVSSGDIFRGGRGWDRRPLSELQIPRTVQDAVRRRTRGLSAAARRVLVLAAVAGRRFDFPLLQPLTGFGEGELLACIKELIAAQLVTEESADRFQFRHALTREAVLTELLARERRQLHREVAAVLEQRYTETPELVLDDLARHTYAAEAWPRAFEYARRAGERAQAMFAPRAAAEQFTRALEAAQALGLPAPTDVLRARGQAHETLGEFERALADHEALLAAVRAAGDRTAEWQALLALGFLWAARDYDRAGGHFDRALALAREMGEAVLVAHSLNRIGNARMMADRPADACRYHEQALAVFEEMDDRHGIAETLDLLGLATMHAGNPIRGIEHYERVAELYRELDDRRGLVTSLAMLGVRGVAFELIPMPMPPLSQVRTDLVPEQAIQIARDIGWRAGEAFALGQLTYGAIARGAYASALQMARQALAVAEEIEHQQWIASGALVVGICYLDLLALPVAIPYLERALTAAQAIRSDYWIAWVAAPLARAYRLQGEFDHAIAVLDAIHCADDPIETSTAAMCALSRAVVLTARGEADAAVAITDRMLAGIASVSPNISVPGVGLVRGEALAAAGRDAEAETTLRDALTVVRQYAASPLEWRLQAALSRFYHVHRYAAQAEHESAAAAAIIDALAANVPDESMPELGGVSLRAHFLRAATSQLPRAHLPTSPADKQRTPGGLTAREREVATLVARGLANREIAGALVLSERTVEYHISNILAKLGAASRAQVAVWAVEHGLTGGVTT